MELIEQYSDIAIRDPDLETVVSVYKKNGLVNLKGFFDANKIDLMQSELTLAQEKLIKGELSDRYGSELLDEPGAQIDGKTFRHYVTYCSDLAPTVRDASETSFLREMASALFNTRDPWLNDYCRFGVVYQDSRSDPGSKYSRIGWHSDFNSDEADTGWPSFAFTIHLDSTSPANGFLRIVPGSHLKDIDKDEIGNWRFDRLSGEIPIFAERGDLILHDYKLWHSAARGTANGLAGRRRHVRGAWHGGARAPKDLGTGTFYKNAAR